MWSELCQILIMTMKVRIAAWEPSKSRKESNWTSSIKSLKTIMAIGHSILLGMEIFKKDRIRGAIGSLLGPIFSHQETARSRNLLVSLPFLPLYSLSWTITWLGSEFTKKRQTSPTLHLNLKMRRKKRIG